MSKEEHTESIITASENLHDSKEFLESVFDRIPGMIYVHDLVKDINLYRSWSLKRILGYEASNKLNTGKGIRKLVHPDDMHVFKTAAKQLYEAEDNECIRFDYRMRHRNGNWLWFRSEEYVYQRGKDGRPTKCLGYATDLTSTVQQQKRLDELNSVNQFMLKAARILSRPEEETTTVLSQLAEEMSGYFQAVCDISILDENSGLIIPQALYHPNNDIRVIIKNLFATTKVKRGEGLVGSVIESGKEVLIQHVPEVMKKGPEQVDPRIVPISLMYFPIRGSGKALGSLNLTRLIGQKEFTDAEIDQVRHLGEYLSLFVENALLREQKNTVAEVRREAEKRLAEEKRWAEFKLTVSSILADVEGDLTTVLSNLCVGITKFFDVVSDIQLINEKRKTVELITIYHYDSNVLGKIEARLSKRELEIGEGMVGQVVKTGKEFLALELPEALRKKSIEEGVDQTIVPRSFVYLPLQSHGKILGTLDLTRLSHQKAINTQELMQMRDLADHAARFIESRLLHLSQKKEIDLRIKAEQKLARSNKLMERMEAETRAMLNAIPIYIARVSKDYRYLFLNDFYHQMGVDPRKMEGRFIAEIIGDKSMKNLMPNFKKVLVGEFVNYEYNGVMADGVHRYFNVALAPDLAADGEVIGFYTCSYDVTAKVLAEKQTQLTQDRLETLSLNSGDAFFFHDENQNIIDVNEVATELLGYSREELCNMKAADIDPRWNGTSYQKFLARVDENVPQTFDSTILDKSGHEIPVEVRFVKRIENDKVYIQSLLRDRTEKREQEKRLQRSEQHLRLIFDNVDDYIATIDENGTIESINRTDGNFRPEDVVGASIYDFFNSDETVAQVKAKFPELVKTGVGFEVEELYQGSSGEQFLSIKYNAVFHQEIFYKAVVIIRDITAERTRERSVMNAVLTGQEQERKRLGAELHDGIGQVLSAIALQVSQIKQQAESENGKMISSGLADLNKNLLQAVKEVRNISHDLMPDVLESFGLKEAVNQVCEALHSRSGVHVSFNHFDLQSKYDPIIEVSMFRVVQELLNNVQKHAGGQNVFVTLMDHDDALVLTVEDDGIGFDLREDSQGIGLKNIRSRVAMINGVVDVESSKNSGTLVNIEVPKSLE